jgi:hypothetical protein
MICVTLYTKRIEKGLCIQNICLYNHKKLTPDLDLVLGGEGNNRVEHVSCFLDMWLPHLMFNGTSRHKWEFEKT